MSTTRSQCRRCTAPLDLDPRHLVVAVPVREPERTASELLATCRRCGSTSVLRVPHRVAAALVVQGAGCLPAVEVEPVRRAEVRAGAAPLELGDLLRLHELLQTDDWFAAVDPGGDAPQS